MGLDIVYSFVDCSDNEWANKRYMYHESHYDKNIHNIDGNINNRFSNNNELLYSLRSVEKHMGWVDNIYLVVDNIKQVPKWLNTDKIKIIEHHDIIPLEYLPTFNSHVIELYLHRIPNISEPFIYFNDDILVGSYIDMTDIIDDNKVKIYMNREYSRRGIPTTEEIGYRSAWKNVNNFLDKKYINENRKKLDHSPTVLYSSIINEIWDELENELNLTSTMKFRSKHDYNITCALHPYYCIYKNMAIQIEDACVNIFENDEHVLEEKFNRIRNKEIKFFCMNHYYPENDQLLIDLFPDKSSFEL